MADPLMSLLGVKKSYGEGVARTEVLHGIDLALHRGEFAALIGPSGSGKSTLLHLLGLLDRATEGRITFDERDVESLSDDERAMFRGYKLGFIFQFHHLLPEFTALENVVLPMMALAGKEKPGMRERARELLSRIGLSDRMNNRATDLSGGQQQRVAIARALAMKPLLVLADEPTGNLDQETGHQVFELMREFNRVEKTSFLIVTHDQRLAVQCERVIEIVDGRIERDEKRS
ncbi:MAG: ABC transporter ATP-binding protein [Acidobacteria bacterium]|nr:ABC transporter ATP-binding protein [Acidobacteriota bacterium]MCG3193394.1 Lipoprotein-releasing system ATP-binding protein LolD [Thermoanaerobaculia bacterium]MCK6684202.1 ABC transporter ATP-binding protein [Thermoanaerobaculia bacterium]